MSSRQVIMVGGGAMKGGGSAEAKPVIESALMKRDQKSGKTWKKRHVVLFPDCIKYYKKKGDSTPRGVMPISADHYVSDISSASEKQRNTFVVSDFVTGFHLAAESKELRDFWMHAIARIIRNLQQKEDWYGEAQGVNRARSDSEVERDYEERLANYKRSQGLAPDAATTAEEEDAIVASIAAEQARRENAAAIAEAKAARLRADREKLQQARLELLEKKRRDAEVRMKAAEEAETKARDRAAAAAKAAHAKQAADAEARARAEALQRQKEIEQERQQDKAAAAARERELRAREDAAKRAAKQRQEEEATAAAAAAAAAASSAPPAAPSRAVAKQPEQQPEQQPGLLSRMMRRVSMTRDAAAAALSSAAPAAPAPSAPGASPAAKAPARGIAARLMQWQDKVEAHQDAQAQNVFSGAHQGGAAKLSKDDPNYGKAAAGSQTEARAQAAREWVDKEIDKLCGVIREQGRPGGGDGALAVISFGELFEIYSNISDSLVGILMRAKKRKRIAYTGDMLFQGMHDAVEIRLLA